MKLITLDDFLMGREKMYPDEFTEGVLVNSLETVSRTNALLKIFYRANTGVKLRTINSGWRPAAINTAIANAAKRSNHLLGRAVDLSDADGMLDAWLLTEEGHKAMSAIGLWMEHPAATPGWCHLQIVPPKSGRRVFYP